MKCANQRKMGCTGRGILPDEEDKVIVYIGHLSTCYFNVDEAKQRSALITEAIDNPENPLTIFQKIRNE